MESVYLSRAAISGWFCIGVTLLSIRFGNQQLWADFLGLFQAANTGTTATTALLAFGAVVAGPGVLGAIFERIAAMILVQLGWKTAHYPVPPSVTEQLQKAFDPVTVRQDALGWQAKILGVWPPGQRLRLLRSADEQSVIVSPGEALHMLLYTSDDKDFREWTNRQRSRIYRCITPILGLATGLIVADWVFNSASFGVMVASAVLIAFLLRQAFVEWDFLALTFYLWSIGYAGREAEKIIKHRQERPTVAQEDTATEANIAVEPNGAEAKTTPKH